MERFNLVFFCHIKKELSEKEEYFLKKNFLSKQEIEIANTIKDAASKCLYLQSHSFKRKILAKQLRTTPGNLEFFNNHFGKPFLVKKENSNDLFFNLSHTEGLTAVVVSNSYNTGIDVEKITQNMDFSLHQNIIFHPKELVEFSNCNNAAAKADFFFRIWTIKECFLKAMGNGFSIEPSQLLAIECNKNDFKIATNGTEAVESVTIRHKAVNGISIAFTTNEYTGASIQQFVFDEKFELLPSY